jgi:uncharacterized membrane protein
MEVLSVLLLIVFIVIVLNQNSNLKTYLQKLERDLRRLQNTVDNIDPEKATMPKPAQQQPQRAPSPQPPPKQQEPEPYISIFTPEEKSEPKEEPASQAVDWLKKQEQQAEQTMAEPIRAAAQVRPTGEQRKIPESKPGFFERNPDLEKFIGENLISKIGIAILVLAIGYFVKYAIDQDWIGPVGRVSIGIFAGAVLIGIAHKLRNAYRAFSSVLAGGGLAVFYFTITLAFHQFQLFNQTTAFIIMIVITIFAVVLALLYDKQELAVIALLGGFLAPFLVSTGQGNYKVLFIYLIVLNSGLLAIAYNKAWRLLNLLSFIFTTILFGTWLINLEYNEPAITYRNGFIFAAIFYLLFFVINIAHNVREKKKFIASDFGILLANTCLFFSAGLYCINMAGADEMRGIFSATMGVFNLAASYLLFRKQKVDSNILYLLIGITLTFISITAPLQLHGNHITLFWASEAVLLYWLFTKSKIRIIQYSSGIVWLLMLISLLMDWVQLYLLHNDALPVMLNRAFITGLFAAAATYFMFLLRNKESKQEKIQGRDILPGKYFFRIVALILLFLSGALEINYQFTNAYPETGFNGMWLLLYTTVFISIATFIPQRVKTLAVSQTTTALLLAIGIVLYFAALNNAFDVQQIILEQHRNTMQFMAHWITAVVVATIIYRLISIIRNNHEDLKEGLSILTWALCAAVVIYLSAEAWLISNNIFYSVNNQLADIQTIFVKTGLPILWGVCSFAFMWLGMHHKNRTLRIVSLSLFTLTLLKLFIFDIQNISAGGKIAAFFCLGVLLLVVSFMYQRLKKIIIDNEKKDD